jgi:hypothetical protein
MQPVRTPASASESPGDQDDDAPYCGQCGYALVGLTESSRCPECGRPLVEVLRRRGAGFPSYGKRYRSKATLFGLPVIDVALGPKGNEPRGRPRGIIAIGDIATGGLAIGGMARGVVAIGGAAFGAFAVGGMAVGLVAATGGFAVGALAAGGGAVGLLASGGGAAGWFAQGGGALGMHTRDGRTPRVIPGHDPFAPLAWFFGHWPPDAYAMYGPLAVTFGLTLAAGALIGLIAWIAAQRAPAVC